MPANNSIPVRQRTLEGTTLEATRIAERRGFLAEPSCLFTCVMKISVQTALLNDELLLVRLLLNRKASRVRRLSIRIVNFHRPRTAVAAIVELVTNLAARNEGQLTRGAGNCISLRVMERQRRPAHEVAPVDSHRLISTQRRIRTW